MLHYNDPVDIQRPVTAERTDGICIGRFSAMASPCEVLVETDNPELTRELTELAAREAWRIEQKYSRYRTDGIIPIINTSNGTPVFVDNETAMLLDFAYQCYQLSNGLFDITSGVLRRVWKFDGKNNLAQQSDIDRLLPLIGLHKARWENPCFTLQPGMEIDFGGICKEYAADRILHLLAEATPLAVLVNLGGDIAARPRQSGKTWQIGIEATDRLDSAARIVHFTQGGIATSGDTRRAIVHDHKRYGHILNPKTGWPAANAPRSVTVLAGSCTQAGILSTMAMLQGKHAEKFLQKENVKYWIQR